MSRSNVGASLSRRRSVSRVISGPFVLGAAKDTCFPDSLTTAGGVLDSLMVSILPASAANVTDEFTGLHLGFVERARVVRRDR